MANFLILIFAALGIVIIIVALGLILAQLLINRADKAQTHANIPTELQESVVIDIDELLDAENQPGMTVISNDVIEGTPHHYHLNKKTISVIDQYAQIDHINNKNTSTEQINAHKGLIIPAKTDTNAISSDTSIVNPLTDKITLEY